MFEAIRKYGSVVTLILMSLALICFVADEYGDSQLLSNQTYASACMAVVDDLDLDDDDDDEDDNYLFCEDRTSESMQLIDTQCQDTEKNKCSKAMLRGQVRRYSPRNGLPNSHNYVILKNTESGAELNRATFFVQRKYFNI